MKNRDTVLIAGFLAWAMPVASARAAPLSAARANGDLEFFNTLETGAQSLRLKDSQQPYRHYRLQDVEGSRKPFGFGCVDSQGRLGHNKLSLREVLESRNGECGDFANVDLRSFALRWVSSMNLRGAYLVRANLRGTILAGYDLTAADIVEANLSGADLNAADLFAANGPKADLSAAQLGRARIIGANLRLARLVGADLREAVIHACFLEGANFNGADLRGASINSNTTGQFVGANLQGALISGYWVGANLSGADLRGAEFSLANLDLVDLRGCDLSTVKNLDDETSLEGAKYDAATKFPAYFTEELARQKGMIRM